MDENITLQAAEAIKQGFDLYHQKFKEITTRAKSRFEQRDWHCMQQDAVERLELYGNIVSQVVAEVRLILGERVKDKKIWSSMKHVYSVLITELTDIELAETFLNSITRRIFATVGVDADIEFVDSDFEAPHPDSELSVCRGYTWAGSTRDILNSIFSDYPFEVGYRDLPGDLDLTAQAIDRHLIEKWGERDIDSVECITSVFYRNQSAFIVGRLRKGAKILPLVFSLRHPESGIRIDAVLMDEDDISIVFSFARWYFHVETEKPHELVAFLKTVLPLKRVAELYISIGYNKHGKTELYRDLLHHLTIWKDKFRITPGEKGMVMLVFDLPSYDVVFKVIRDHFSEPKTATRQEVIERYRLVFTHDRAGRLVDAQEFEHLRFERSRFSDELLNELLQSAPESVTIEGNSVSIKHLYTERRTTPLNIYIKENDLQSAIQAVIDYGTAIKDMAATNIFPGDILLKNFGVTRHGRVVFYDYDELGFLTDFTFRHFPQASDDSENYQPEPWFYVGRNDIFPEEFKTFLGLQGELRKAFMQAHQDLFEVEFWREMQERIQAGEIVETLPYPENRSLRASD